jgi:hypothetical protein
VAYFLEPGRVLNASYFNLFQALLGMPDATPLREQLAASTDRLLLLLGYSQHPQVLQQKAAAPAAAAAAAAPAGNGGEAAPPAAPAAGGAAAEGAPDAAAAAPAAAGDALAAAPAPAAAATALSPEDATTVAYRGVQLIQLLIKDRPEWLAGQATLFKALCERWKANCAVKVCVYLCACVAVLVGLWCRAACVFLR